MKSAHQFAAARNAVMMGDAELALRRLENAVAAGWRDYNIERRDPRWSSLANDERYQAIMEGVAADVDRQREIVLKIDAREGR